MSVNPLKQYDSMTIKHVMVGFKYTEDACFTEIHTQMGVTGTVFQGKPCGGPCVVMINEFEDPTFSIADAETSWNYFAPTSKFTTSYAGNIQIADRTGALFGEKFKEWANTLGVGYDHIIISWKTFFVCENRPINDRTSNSPTQTIIEVNPLIFQTASFIQTMAPALGRVYALNFTASYNTFGQMPQISKLYQTTITHADGNLHNEIPRPEGATSGITPRVVEDAAKKQPRQTRIDKSKPMKNFKDLFEAFAKELMEQKHVHKRQLQEWLQNVRDNFDKKTTEPRPFNPPLPIDYIIGIPSEYNDYPLDNRNMPFEQPEQSQTIKGIRSFSPPTGSTIQTAIDSMMMLSRKIAYDFKKASPYSFRHNTCVIRRCEGKYDVFIKIAKVLSALNEYKGVNTGPGENIISAPIEYTYQDSAKKDSDIISINYRNATTVTHKSMEVHLDSGEAPIVYGDREATSYEREPGKDFFATGFGGVHGTTNDIPSQSLESSELVSDILNYSPYQTAIYSIKVIGNPLLLNDINRNPWDVKEDTAKDGVWKYQIYGRPETFPMHAKVTISIDSGNKMGDRQNETPPIYYFNDYMHIAKIHNKFTGGRFTQTLDMLRTDNI